MQQIRKTANLVWVERRAFVNQGGIKLFVSTEYFLQQEVEITENGKTSTEWRYVPKRTEDVYI